MQVKYAYAALLLIAAPLSQTAAEGGGRWGLAQVVAPADAAKRAALPVSLEVLLERSDYAKLGKLEVQSVARAAELKWPREFAGFTYQRVERFSAAGQSHWMSIWTHRKTGLEFALIPGGRFQMGSPSGESNRKGDEAQHWVTLDPFLIARTECTQGAWDRLKELESVGGSSEEVDQRPKAGLDPGSVEEWCVEAGFTLPTEAQWEFMCRAGTTSAWGLGDDRQGLQGVANLGSAECPADWIGMPGITEPWRDGYGSETAPVGMFATNAFGLFDVHGNVCEWTRDEYMGYEVLVERGTGARPGKSGERIARGGNFGSDADFARSAGRFHCGSGISPGANHGFGFRLSLDLPFPASLEGWPSETFELPPGFARELPAGLESLRFAPGWRKPLSEDFWSYAFVMWIDEPVADAKRVGELLDGYYDGLMSVFAGNAGHDIGTDPAEVEVVKVAPNRFEATMYVTDAFSTFEPIDIRILVDTIPISEGQSAVRVRLSPQPAEHKIWRSLETAIASIKKP